jgi:hypothetical protein
MLQYTIVGANNRDDAVSVINEALRGGWKLHGGLCVMYSDAKRGISYSQAMIKEVPFQPLEPFSLPSQTHSIT